MRGKTLLATLAISAMLFSGCGIKSGQTIIKVNDTKITQGEFDKMFDEQASGGMFKALGVNIKDGRNDFMYFLVKERVINELIIKALLEQEIAKRDIKVTDADVDEAIKDIIDKIGSKEHLNALLKQNGVSNAQFRKDLKQEVTMKKLAEQLGTTTVLEGEAKKFYNENIDKFKLPEKVRASHILISVNPAEIIEVIKSDPQNKNLDEAAIKAKVDEEIKAKETKANKLLADVKKDKSKFAKIAKENSDDTISAAKGGDLGFFAEREMVPEFSKAAFSMKPNTISDKLVKSQYGYHIIMVTDRHTASVEPFEKVKADITAFLINKKQVDLVDSLAESLKKSATIKYVNPDYDPENVRKNVQETIKKQEELDKKAAEETKKAKNTDKK